MTTKAFTEVIRADPADRADLFLTTARRLGVPLIPHITALPYEL